MSADKSQHSAGWYAGALVFWLLSAWLVTVGLSSIIPQIFWPGGDVSNSASSCVPELRQLRRELLEHAKSHLLRTPQPSERSHRLAFFERWDKQLFHARPACHDDERDAWTELNRLRHGMHALIERFEREEAPRLERLEQLLGSAEATRAQLLEDQTHE